MKVPSRFRLNLNDNIVRAFLGEYKLINSIPALCPLTDRQRGDFEVWAITEGRRRNIDVFGLDAYLSSIISANEEMLHKQG